MIYKETNVFDEALNRIRMIYDTHDDVAVAMSGGKDSTVVFNLAYMVAKEKGRLPLKVFWLDQEAEWQSTVDYMESIMRREDVDPYWFQIEFDFTNSLSPQKNFLRLWDKEKEQDWIHPKSDIAIKEYPHEKMRFHEIYKELQSAISEPGKETAVLCGMRIDESPARRLHIVGEKGKWRGMTWCSMEYGDHCRQFYPIYDFKTSDVWTAIAKNKWTYNKLYDRQYQYGIPSVNMRCSALIHETAWHNIRGLQEFEPKTYDRFCKRVAGTSTYSHALDTNDVMPKTLPFMFKNWREYRDYLLVNIVKPEYHELFRKRWANQNSEEWYKVHVRECIINDIDGTINHNMAVNIAQRDHKKKAKQLKAT